MDHSEQTPDQLQQIDDGATQIPAVPAFGYTLTPVLATSTLRAPVSFPTLLPQISYYHNRLPRQPAQHFYNLEQRLRLFWESQRQQVEQTTNFRNYSVPLARIRKIMKADQDVNMIATETPVLFAKAVEMFIIDMTLRGWAHTEEDRRRILQRRDIAAAISETDIFDFLTDVIPKHLLKPTNDTIPHAGSPAITTYQYVPAQNYPVLGPSGAIMYAGGQQPQPYMALPQIQPPLKPFIDWEQSFIPWAPQPQQNNQESSVILAALPQQMQHNNQQEDDNEEV